MRSLLLKPEFFVNQFIGATTIFLGLRLRYAAHQENDEFEMMLCLQRLIK